VKRIVAVAAVALVAAFAAEVALVQPKDLAADLTKGGKPAIFQVGPNLMYRSRHIAGAVYAGPGSKAEGLEMLAKAVKDLPRDREIVIYCGCCPWDRCPNIKPAFEELAKMGFTRVKALYLAENFKVNWTDAGYPVER
jgi:thiosulfate/3-mercaptopyruvate sulfurtransferase